MSDTKKCICAFSNTCSSTIQSNKYLENINKPTGTNSSCQFYKLNIAGLIIKSQR